MRIADSRYHMVWKVKEENGFTKVELGDSKKNKDGSYDNFKWFDCLLAGGAKDKDVKEGDVITIIAGLVNKRKYKDKYYDNVVIFDFEVTDSKDISNNKDEDLFEEEDVFMPTDDDDLPF